MYPSNTTTTLIFIQRDGPFLRKTDILKNKLKQKLHSRARPYCVNLVRIVHFDAYKNNYG